MRANGCASRQLAVGEPLHEDSLTSVGLAGSNNAMPRSQPGTASWPKTASIDDMTCLDTHGS